MIINGGARSGARSLATHLLNQAKNERVQVLDVRGCLATDLRGALVEMEESAEATRCLRPLYHANIDPDRNVRMTPEQWKRSIDALEEKLGLQEHARAVVMHQKHGREHIHVVWNRVDLETMRTVSDSHNYRKHELVARDLEREFGHERVQGAHIERGDQPRPDRTAPKWAMQQGERLQIDPRQVKAQVKELWEGSDSGRSFAAALDHHGLALAKGDRRDFIVVDQAGGIHSLGRCTDAKAAAVRSRMGEVDREALPTVDEAITQMRKRSTEREARREVVGKEVKAAAAEIGQTPLPQPERVVDETVLNIRAAYALNDNAREFATFLEDHGIYLAVVTAKDERNRNYCAGDVVALNSAGQVYALDRHATGEDRQDVDKFLGALDREKLQGIEATQKEINLRTEQFIALTQVGLLNRPSLEPSTPLPQPVPEKQEVDFRRYIDDANYRREVQRQQEQQRPPSERQRGGRER